ncbi:Ig-like domain-containing protein [Photobacterium leiognathi]|uniref:Ig-like domain-containing protein n=1 Tax=Photobacterium leiognathi TaxID=553611 RepID=UPI001EE067C9|nr:Ig-like domain-containing protein [Photobacterium leiognathi]MCG3885607.1 Ig-like domain-containing protein [Photobacterium leiognathi]
MNISFVRLLCASFFLISLLTGCKGGSDGAFTSVTPNENTLTSIKIIAQQPKQSETSTYIGGQLSFVAEGFYSNGSKVNLTDKVQWNSSSEATATIDNQGILVGIEQGIVNITASYNGVKSNNVSVNITDAILQSLKVTPEITSVPKGVPVPLTVTAKLSNDSTVDVTKWVDWSYSSVPTNITNNIFSSKEVGNYQIIASLQGIDSNIVSVTVTSPELVSFIITPNNAESTVYRNVPLQLTAEGKYSDGSTYDITNSVEWHSSEPQVVSVSETGQVKYLKDGLSSISASLDDMHSNVVNVKSTEIHITFTFTKDKKEGERLELALIPSKYDIFLYKDLDFSANLNLDETHYKLAVNGNVYTYTITSLPSALKNIVLQDAQVGIVYYEPDSGTGRSFTSSSTGSLKGKIIVRGDMFNVRHHIWKADSVRHMVYTRNSLTINPNSSDVTMIFDKNGNGAKHLPISVTMTDSISEAKSYSLILKADEDVSLTGKNPITAHNKNVVVSLHMSNIALKYNTPIPLVFVDESDNRVECEPFTLNAVALSEEHFYFYKALAPSIVFDGKTCKINN